MAERHAGRARRRSAQARAQIANTAGSTKPKQAGNLMHLKIIAHCCTFRIGTLFFMPVRQRLTCFHLPDRSALGDELCRTLSKPFKSFQGWLLRENQAARAGGLRRPLSSSR